MEEALEVDRFCWNEPLCGGTSPPRSDANVVGGSSQRASQSSEGTEFVQACPLSLSAQHVRRACHARESLKQFEAQYSEIQQMLARNPTRPAADRRRSDANMRMPVPHTIHHDSLPPAQAVVEGRVKEHGSAMNAAAQPSRGVQPYHAAADCETAEYLVQGAIDMGQAADCLLAKALTLRGLVTELSASVSRSTQTSKVGQCTSVTVGTCERETGQAAPVSDGQSQTGHSRAHDAVELAGMKALASTVSPLQLSRQHPTDILCDSPGGNLAAQVFEANENEGILANMPAHDANESASGGKGSVLKGKAVRSQIVYSPVSDDVEVDAMGDLHVGHVQDIVLPASARAIFHGREQLGIWLAWRMPGVVSTRPCLHLMDVSAAEVLSGQNGSLAMAGKQVNVWAQVCVLVSFLLGWVFFQSGCQLIAMWVQVPLALSRLRSSTTLGQPACLQCELWLLAGDDSTHALSQANLSLLIGLCSISLQFCAPENGVVVLSRGYHTLPNVLEGWDGAKLEVQLTAGEDLAQDLEHILPKRSQTRTDSPDMPVREAAVTEEVLDDHDQGDAAPAQRSPDLIHHAFEVHMLSMNDLPSPTSATAPPVARYLKYVVEFQRTVVHE